MDEEALLRLVVGEARLPARVTLRYTAADPFTVHVIFHPTHKGVRWALSRELLAQGLTAPAGIADVRVEPREQHLELTLTSPDGTALLEVPRAVLADFLERTYAIVPPGEESVEVSEETLRP